MKLKEFKAWLEGYSEGKDFEIKGMNGYEVSILFGKIKQLVEPVGTAINLMGSGGDYPPLAPLVGAVSEIKRYDDAVGKPMTEWGVS